MGVYRKASGLIFDDGFDSGSLHARYTLSPGNTGFLDKESGQYVLNHTEEDNLMLFDIPESQYNLLMELTAEYIPAEYGDEGGIVVWKDGESRIEFLESMDTAVREYSRLRALREGNRWTFYADRGAGWELFDTESLVAAKIGIALKGKQIDGYHPMRIERIVLCRGNKITVGNLPEGFLVYLCDGEGVSVASAVVEKNWTGVEIKIPSAPYNGILKVYDSQGNLVSSLGAFDIYGGDSFLYGTELKVLWKGKELSVEGETYLGTMYDNMLLLPMEIMNPSTTKPARQVQLGILQYLDTFGYEWADLCEDDGSGSPRMVFSRTLELPEVAPLESRRFWMKVERKYEHFGISPMDFILDINHV